MVGSIYVSFVILVFEIAAAIAKTPVLFCHVELREWCSHILLDRSTSVFNKIASSHGIFGFKYKTGG